MDYVVMAVELGIFFAFVGIPVIWVWRVRKKHGPYSSAEERAQREYFAEANRDSITNFDSPTGQLYNLSLHQQTPTKSVEQMNEELRKRLEGD